MYYLFRSVGRLGALSVLFTFDADEMNVTYMSVGFYFDINYYICMCIMNVVPQGRPWLLCYCYCFCFVLGPVVIAIVFQLSDICNCDQ